MASKASASHSGRMGDNETMAFPEEIAQPGPATADGLGGQIAQAARQAALDAGFDLAGIAPVRREDFRKWTLLSSGWTKAARAR